MGSGMGLFGSGFFLVLGLIAVFWLISVLGLIAIFGLVSVFGFLVLRFVAFLRLVLIGIRFRLLGVDAADGGEQLGLMVQSGKANKDVVRFAVAAILKRDPPAFGENAEDVLESVRRGDRPSGERDDFIVDPQAAAIGVGVFEDLGDEHAAVVGGGDGRTERGVIENAAAFEAADEILRLIDGDGVADADVHPAPLLERARPLMPINCPWALNSGPPELPGLIAASTCRQSEYSKSVPAGY